VSENDLGMWSQVLTEKGAVLAFFGALGGAVRSATLRTTWRESLRIIFIGSATAFGLGEVSPTILRWIFGEAAIPESASTAVGFIAAMAFIVGLIAVVLVEYLIERSQGGGRDGPAA